MSSTATIAITTTGPHSPARRGTTAVRVQPGHLWDGNWTGLPAAIRSSARRLRRVSGTAAAAGEIPRCVPRYTDAQGARQGDEDGAVAPERAPRRRDRPQPAAVARTSNSRHDHWSTPLETPVLTPGTKRPTDRPEGYELGDSARTAEACREDAESAAVETRLAYRHLETVAPDTGCSRRSRAMRRSSPLACGASKRSSHVHRAPPEHLRQHLLPGPELGIPIGIRLHDLCVDAE